jgi:TRAP-type mannitol/chloroaromatic compound transport system permease large subunit
VGVRHRFAWTEVIVIFVPVFLQMPKLFNIDPILCGRLVVREP